MSVNRFSFAETRTFIAVASLIAMLLPETVYAVPTYSAEIPGTDQVRVVDSPSPAFLSNRTEIVVRDSGGNVAGQATREEIAAASYGQIRGSSNADYLNVHPFSPFGTTGIGSQESSSFYLDDLILTGPPGNILVSFNYAISGSIGGTTVTTGNPAFYNWYVSVQAGGVIGSSVGAGGFSIGGMSADFSGAVSRSGIFSAFPLNSEGTAMGTSPQVLTFAGDPALRFGMDLATGAQVQVGMGAEPGSTNSHASFANTFGFPTSGPVANLPQGYTLNSISGHIVNNQFVAPDPAGDYNGDGIIDAADYVIWRKTDGTQSGYNSWRTYFGQFVGTSSGATGSVDTSGDQPSPAVPEPSTLVVLVVVVPLLGYRRRAIAS